jgi:uncharacterized protein
MGQMKHTETQVLLRIFLQESYKFKGQPTYQYLLRYLREHDFAGATVLRGIEGVGRAHRIHTADILELSTDLSVVVEIVDTTAKIASLLGALEDTGMVGGALVTEEPVTVHRFGSK